MIYWEVWCGIETGGVVMAMTGVVMSELGSEGGKRCRALRFEKDRQGKRTEVFAKRS